eukprot:scaffold83408_cov86-Phaeocystis_antarctica.AAC.2
MTLGFAGTSEYKRLLLIELYCPCSDTLQIAIAAARPFLGLYPPQLLWLKALDALYNFPAVGKVVGG